MSWVAYPVLLEAGRLTCIRLELRGVHRPQLLSTIYNRPTVQPFHCPTIRLGRTSRCPNPGTPATLAQQGVFSKSTHRPHPVHPSVMYFYSTVVVLCTLELMVFMFSASPNTCTCSRAWKSLEGKSPRTHLKLRFTFSLYCITQNPFIRYDIILSLP